MKTESDVQRMFIRACESCNGLVLNIHGHAMQKSGWPDIFVSHARLDGGCWIEFKKDSNQCDTNQMLKLEKLRHRGSHAFVARYLNSDGCLYAEDSRQNSLGLYMELDVLKESAYNAIEFIQEVQRLSVGT